MSAALPVRSFALLAGIACLGTATPAPRAQSAAETGLVAEAEAAYRDGRPADAVARLDAYLDANDTDAEAHYLLGRILYDDRSPVRDERRAARAVDRAVALDPDNVVYLVANLEGQRQERTNILLDLIRARRRYVLAERILALDPGNAYAHEELGTWAIRDYYQYRNAVALPGTAFATPNGGVLVTEQEIVRANTATNADGDQNGLEVAVDAVFGPDAFAFDDADAAFASDRFDIDALRAQNQGVVTFEARATRAYADAVGHLRAALDADPRRRSVYDHVARLAAISGRWADAAPDLREMNVQFPDDAGMWRYTGLAAQRTGRYEDADAAFAQALRRMPEAEVAAFTDLALILPPDEVGAFEADPVAFATRYWTSRDPRFLNAVNERRTEHYARLAEADLLYRADALDLPGWKTVRGRLFVRYGPPRTDVVIDGTFAQVVEAYAGIDSIFEEEPPGASDAERSANRFNVWTFADGLRLVFEDPNRNGQFRLYSPPAYAYALRSARGADRMDFVERAEEAVRETPERYTFASPGRQVELPYRVTAFKGDSLRTDLYVHYGVPLALGASAAGADVDLTLRTGAFLVGADRDLLVERRRTVYGLRAAQIVGFAETRLWTNTEPLVAPPGANEVSLEFETSDGGTSAVQRRAVDVPDFSRPGLQISDVMLAYDVDADGAAGPGRVVRRGVGVLPAPWGVFASGTPVFVYVEFYGLGLRDGRTDFEVEADLVPKDLSTGVRRLGRRLLGRREAGVSATYEAQGASADEAQDVQLDTRGQRPGLYTLTVRVRDRVTGAEAERATDLLLEGEATP